jgi:mannuronan 5-epimerase
MMTSFVSLMIILLLSLYATSSDSYSSEIGGDLSLSGHPSNCITFNSEERIITITCEATNLTEIADHLNDPNVLSKDSQVDKGWILNAGIVVGENAALYINSTDISWLKITPEETADIANGIQVHGSLKIDSVKISSWDPETNDYVMFEVLHKPREEGAKTDYDTVARPYIRVEEGATGTTDITNSELAYLGYEEVDDNHGRSGLLYYGGDGSLVKGNQIHHLRFGFYSSGVGNITLEDNVVAHNYMYGFDPHTGTHDMIIRNNTVYDSGAMGVICSLDCYNILIEDNEIYNSFGSGIMFSRNMTDSIARNNYIHDEDQCIFVSASHNNQVYNNTVSNCINGIYLRSESSNNDIHNNTIRNTVQGIYVNTGASDNEFGSNAIVNATELGININEGDDDGEEAGGNNVLLDNTLVNATLPADTQDDEDGDDDGDDTPDRD